MQPKNSTKIPRSVAGLIACLEMCLDVAWRERHRGGMSQRQRESWEWLDAALDTPQIQIACERLDGATKDYLYALLADYRAAVFPDPVMGEEENTQLDLFAFLPR